jgi:hypothetical protein
MAGVGAFETDNRIIQSYIYFMYINTYQTITIQLNL